MPDDGKLTTEDGYAALREHVVELARAARERHGPSPLFLAQYFAQETANAEGDAVVPAQAAAGYPSLGFDQDILLPGEATAFATDGPRVNILV